MDASQTSFKPKHSKRHQTIQKQDGKKSKVREEKYEEKSKNRIDFEIGESK